MTWMQCQFEGGPRTGYQQGVEVADFGYGFLAPPSMVLVPGYPGWYALVAVSNSELVYRWVDGTP